MSVRSGLAGWRRCGSRWKTTRPAGRGPAGSERRGLVAGRRPRSGQLPGLFSPEPLRGRVRGSSGAAVTVRRFRSAERALCPRSVRPGPFSRLRACEQPAPADARWELPSESRRVTCVASSLRTARRRRGSSKSRARPPRGLRPPMRTAHAGSPEINAIVTALLLGAAGCRIGRAFGRDWRAGCEDQCRLVGGSQAAHPPRRRFTSLVVIFLPAVRAPSSPNWLLPASSPACSGTRCSSGSSGRGLALQLAGAVVVSQAGRSPSMSTAPALTFVAVLAGLLGLAVFPSGAPPRSGPQRSRGDFRSNSFWPWPARLAGRVGTSIPGCGFTTTLDQQDEPSAGSRGYPASIRDRCWRRSSVRAWRALRPRSRRRPSVSCQEHLGPDAS